MAEYFMTALVSCVITYLVQNSLDKSKKTVGIQKTIILVVLLCCLSIAGYAFAKSLHIIVPVLYGFSFGMILSTKRLKDYFQNK